MKATLEPKIVYPDKDDWLDVDFSAPCEKDDLVVIPSMRRPSGSACYMIVQVIIIPSSFGYERRYWLKPVDLRSEAPAKRLRKTKPR
jgi:hypothetical protein